MLLVTHEATRTGAPRVALTWARWLRRHTDIDLEILALRGGPLLSEFEAVAPTRLVPVLQPDHPAALLERGLSRAGAGRLASAAHLVRLRAQCRGLRGYDAIWLNSCTAARVLRALDAPVIIGHIHEMASAFNHWLPPRDRRELLARSDLLVAASEAVAQNLRDVHEFPNVSVHHEFIEPVDRTQDLERASIRTHLAGQASAVVGAVGTADWRKGADLFVQLAAVVRRRRPDLNVAFRWVGGEGDGAGFTQLHHDAARAGVQDALRFVGEVDDARPLIETMDVLCVTSREDPFPLVALEAGSAGVPVVSFAQGGLVELLTTSGVQAIEVVDYLDVESFAERVIDLLDDEAERTVRGNALREAILRSHLTEVAAPRLLATLNDCLPHDLRVEAS